MVLSTNITQEKIYFIAYEKNMKPRFKKYWKPTVHLSKIVKLTKENCKLYVTTDKSQWNQQPHTQKSQLFKIYYHNKTYGPNHICSMYLWVRVTQTSTAGFDL